MGISITNSIIITRMMIKKTEEPTASPKEIFPLNPEIGDNKPDPLFDTQTPLNNEQEEKIDTVIKEYMQRPHFEYLMTSKDEKIYTKKLMERLQDKEFTKKYGIKRDKRGMLLPGMKEKAAINMGQYYFKHWTGFKFGKPKLIISKDQVNIQVKPRWDVDPKNGQPDYSKPPNFFFPLFSFSFDSPYRTVYDGEQSLKYYLKKYPDGQYTVPALFGIAKCRIHQEDYVEALHTYTFGIRAAIKQVTGLDEKEVARSVAMDLLRYAKKYGEKLNVSLDIKVNTPYKNIYDSERFETKWYFDKKETTFNIRVAYHKAF